MGLEYLKTLEANDKFNTIRKCVSVLLIGCLVLSFAYFMYWLILMCNDYSYSYTKDVMLPLAQLLHPNITGYAIFKATAQTLALFIIPLFCSYYVIDKIEQRVVKSINKTLDEKQEIEQEENIQDTIKQLDNIKKYSICLSLDYSSNSVISNVIKNKITLAIYTKLKRALTDKSLSPTMYNTNTFIYLSNNFAQYDLIYESIINTLAQSKKALEKVYPLTIVPTITTDAYTFSVPQNEIVRRHEEIKNLISRNKATTTDLFVTKYRQLNKAKYAGVPSGEYVTSDNYRTNCYQLNVVNDNLEALSSRV